MNRDYISGIFLLALSGWLWWYTGSFPQLDDGYPGPSLFPRLIALGLFLAGISIIFKGMRNKGAAATRDRARISAGILRLGAGFGLVLAYPIAAQWVHFVPVMGGFILIFGLLLKNQAWHAILMAVLSAGLMYLMFTQLLGVPL